jgi:hypothetical protein
MSERKCRRNSDSVFHKHLPTRVCCSTESLDCKRQRHGLDWSNRWGKP